MYSTTAVICSGVRLSRTRASIRGRRRRRPPGRPGRGRPRRRHRRARGRSHRCRRSRDSRATRLEDRLPAAGRRARHGRRFRRLVREQQDHERGGHDRGDHLHHAHERRQPGHRIRSSGSPSCRRTRTRCEPQPHEQREHEAADDGQRPARQVPRARTTPSSRTRRRTRSRTANARTGAVARVGLEAERPETVVRDGQRHEERERADEAVGRPHPDRRVAADLPVQPQREADLHDRQRQRDRRQPRLHVDRAAEAESEQRLARRGRARVRRHRAQPRSRRRSSAAPSNATPPLGVARACRRLGVQYGTRVHGGEG